MAVFSVNQVRQLYPILGASDYEIKKFEDGTFSVVVKDVLGKNQHTDNVELAKVSWVHKTTASAMEPKLKLVTLTLNDDAFVGGNTISGQDYILRINLRQYYGMSDEDIYQKYGAVHGTKSMTKATFIAAMAASLYNNFSREEVPSLIFKIGSSVVAGTVKNSSGQTVAAYDNNGTLTEITGGTSLIILEAPQTADWSLGTKQIKRIYFDVIPTTVVEPDNYDEIIWGTTASAESEDTIANSYVLADMEYFYHGYRGDQYRNLMWPKSIPTKYQLEAGDDVHYDVVDIQYYYSGDNEDIQHSAKTMTFVFPSAEENSIADAFCDALVTAGIDENKIKKVPAETESDDSSD